MDGQPTALVTGSTSGIGLALCTELARRDVAVVVHGRTEGSAKAAAMRIGAAVQQQIPYLTADLTSQDQVRTLASQVRERFGALNLLVHNAGIQQAAFGVVDGREETFAVNHLASYLLTHELFDVLATNGPARVVFVSSAAHSWGTIHWDDLVGYGWYQPELAYAQAKLASLLTTQELARRTRGGPVTILTVNPGSTRTTLGEEVSRLASTIGQFWRPLMRRPSTVARELATICLHQRFARAHGAYVARGLIRQPARSALDVEAQRRMWSISAQLTSVDPQWPQITSGPTRTHPAHG